MDNRNQWVTHNELSMCGGYELPHPQMANPGSIDWVGEVQTTQSIEE